MKRTKHSILNMLVRDAQPNGALGRICQSELDSFFDEKKTKSGWVIHESEYSRKATNWHERYAFKDNGATVLAVAHCDTVWENLYPYDFDAKECKVYTPELDDRLGVYIITRLLPRLGVKCDVLLTENEEFCASTAQIFKTDKKYNWIMEWDRRGAGAVLYQYDTPELREKLQLFDFKIDYGTYSDICDLYWLKVSGINFATGYSLEHTKSCFADLRCLARQVSKFLRFYAAYKDTKMESNAGTHYAGRWGGAYRDNYNDYADSRYTSLYDDEGYYDKFGKWHFYSTSATSKFKGSLYKPVQLKYRECVCCGERSKVRTSYLVRDMYICPTCEHKCTSCGYTYHTMQIDATTGLCKRCKAVMDSLTQVPSVYKECGVCHKIEGCVEVWTDAWVCHNCLWEYFVICDECLSLLPAQESGKGNFAAVGICKICENKHKEESKNLWQHSCDGCGEVHSAKELTFFVREGLHLCEACLAVYMDGDTNETTDGTADGPFSNDDDVIGYDFCDFCGERSQLYEFEGLQICEFCRSRATTRGL